MGAPGDVPVVGEARHPDLPLFRYHDPCGVSLGVYRSIGRRAPMLQPNLGNMALYRSVPISTLGSSLSINEIARAPRYRSVRVA